MLDKSKPYGTVYGLAHVAYEQNGKFYDIYCNETTIDRENTVRLKRKIGESKSDSKRS